MMNWSGIGLNGSVWELRFRELEHFVRGRLYILWRDPEQELPDVDLPDGERQAAVRREAARRMVTERS